MSTFKNKHILITGGAGGIGFLMGREVLEHGAKKLIIWDVNEENISKSLASLSDYSERVFTHKVDISEPDQVYQTAEQVLAEHHHIDILINNAGTVVGGSFSDHGRSDIERLIRINLLGTMHTTRAFLDAMIRKRLLILPLLPGVWPTPECRFMPVANGGLSDGQNRCD